MTNWLLLLFAAGMVAILIGGGIITGGLLVELFAKAIPR
jgi:hypothetical protein